MIIGVLLPLPFNEPFDYQSEEELPLGTIVRVPWGREEQIGVVWKIGKSSDLDEKRIRPVSEKLNLPPIAESLRKLVEFTAEVEKLRCPLAGYRSAETRPLFKSRNQEGRRLQCRGCQYPD